MTATGVLFLLAGGLSLVCSGGLADGAGLAGLRATAAAALLVGLATLGLRRRLPPPAAHLLVLSGSAMITLSVVLTAGSAAAVAVAGTYALVAIDAAFFFAPPAAALHLGGSVAACLLTLGPRSGLGPAALVAGTSVVVAGVVGWLVRAAAAADVDHLTALPNRRALDRQLRDALLRAQRTRDPLSVALLDLDGFKHVNDTLGHAEGDRLIRTATACWSALLGPGQVLARQGGDEFVVVLPGLAAPEAVALVDRLRAALPAGRTCSAGVAQWQPGTSDGPGRGGAPSGSLLLARADTALYQAKRAGRDCIRAHTAAASAGGELRAALARGEILVDHRPVARLQSDGRPGEVVGSVAHLRWQHPQRGRLVGAELPPVGASEVAVELGRHLLVRACTDAARWHAVGGPRSVAVALSAAHLREPTCTAHLRSVLERTGLPADALLLEVTEAVLEAAGPGAPAVLAALRALGVRVALTGFGAGCSSLTRLAGLPVDVVAVDPALLAGAAPHGAAPDEAAVDWAAGHEAVADRAAGHEAAPDEAAASLVRAVVAGARALGLEVRADGVDDPGQAALLAALGCGSVSGALVGGPAPAADLRPAPSAVAA